MFGCKFDMVVRNDILKIKIGYMGCEGSIFNCKWVI
jgi:hypothetical protein